MEEVDSIYLIALVTLPEVLPSTLNSIGPNFSGHFPLSHHIIETLSLTPRSLGLWLRDLHASIFASSYYFASSDENHYIDTNINSDYFPSAMSANTTFRVQSVAATYPTEIHSHFDLVHQRLVLPGCDTYPLQNDVASLCTLVKPSD